MKNSKFLYINYITLFIFIIIINSLNCEINKHFCYHLVNEAKNEEDLISKIKTNFEHMKDDSPYCIEHLLKTSYYKALEKNKTTQNNANINLDSNRKNKKRKN